MQGATDLFEAERQRLIRLAYRMLGSVSEAEDVVQAAWLRWHSQDHAAIVSPAAWLTRTVSRLSLDVMKSARVQRETYVGPWLPEPLVEDTEEEPDDDRLTTALMMALERLSPLERAAFLLHDIFGVDFAEVGRTLDRDPATCRQLAARARAHVQTERPRFAIAPEAGDALARAFFAASREGDVKALEEMLAAEVVIHSDGGGIRPAAIVPIVGRYRAIKLFTQLVRLGAREGRLLRVVRIDGLPGFVTLEKDGLVQTTALDIGPEGIRAIYVVRNPEKLSHVEHDTMQ